MKSNRNTKSSGVKRRVLFPKLYESVDQKSPLFSHQVRTAAPIDETHSEDQDLKTFARSKELNFNTFTGSNRSMPMKREEDKQQDIESESLAISKKDSNTQRDIVQLMKQIDEIETTATSEIQSFDHDDHIIQTQLNITSHSNESEHDHDLNKSPTSTASHLEEKQSPLSNVTTLTTILPGKPTLKTPSILKNKSSRSPRMTPPLSHSSSSETSLPETMTQQQHHIHHHHQKQQQPLQSALKCGSTAHEHHLFNKEVPLPLKLPIIDHKKDEENKKNEHDVDGTIQKEPDYTPEKPKMLLHKSYSETFADTLPKEVSLSFSALTLHDSPNKKMALHKKDSFQDIPTVVPQNDGVIVADHETKEQTTKPMDTFKIKSYIRKNSSGVLSTTSTASVITRHMSHEEMEQSRKIRFDPRVWVHEVQRPAVEKTWYSHSEIDRFKHEAIMRIRNWTLKRRKRTMSDEIISTGTGRVITRGAGIPVDKNLRALYTNPALRSDAEDDDEEEDVYIMDCRRRRELLKEIRTVLIVDSHDIFLSLLAKDIKSMLPHIKVVTAYTVQEASHRMDAAKRNIDGKECTHGFDLIVVEERLMQGKGRYRSISLPNDFEKPPSKSEPDPSSGSSLIQRIAHEVDLLFHHDAKDNASDEGAVNHSNNVNDHRVPLVIGMSAYVQQDGTKLKDCGADMVWGKPPPKMDETLRNEILRLIMMKRNRKNISMFDP